MATWLILVLAALVLAVIGANTAATWLLALAVVVLVAGVVWVVAGRLGRNRGSAPSSRNARRGDV